MSDVERPALAHAHAEGYNGETALNHFWYTSTLYRDGDSSKWAPGKDDDPVEFGVSINRDSAAFFDEDVFEALCELDDASERVHDAVRELAEAGVLDEVAVCINVELDAGIESDELVNLEGMR